MIKLLKYDLRRTMSLLLAVAVMLILAELILIWSPLGFEVKIVLAVLFNFAAAVIFTINNLRVFDYNIKSVSRRLLPVSTLSYVWSSLIYGVLNTLALMLIAGGAALYFIRNFDTFALGDAFHFPAYIWAGIVVEAALVTVYGFIMFYMVIALARSLTRKGVLWVGLLLFIVLSIVIDWVENLLFGTSSSEFSNLVSFQVKNGVLTHDTVSVGMGSNAIGSFVFELLLCVAFLMVIKWCVEKKIEAK